MPSGLDSKIDELYQLPLQAFTTARNTLAKELSGSEKRLVQSLAKPTLPIWSVNQLYWQDRPAYKALIDAAEKFRGAHRAALAGKKPDLRGPEQVHRAAVDRAFAKTIGIIHKMGTGASDVVVDQVRRALSALPSDEPAGRMTRVPEPVGFALLAGVKPREIKSGAGGARSARGAEGATKAQLQLAERAKARELSEAKSALRRAQQKAESAAFAARRAANDVERARKIRESLDEKLASADLLARKTASEVKEAERRLAELRGQTL